MFTVMNGLDNDSFNCLIGIMRGSFIGDYLRTGKDYLIDVDTAQLREVSPSRTAYFVSSAILNRFNFFIIICRCVSMVLILTLES